MDSFPPVLTAAFEAVPTRCDDPATLTNPFPAYRDTNLFSQAHFTQMMFAPAPRLFIVNFGYG